MDSDIAKEMYDTTKNIGFIGLTYYDAGLRNFYTKNKPIMHPNDLKGLKIRVLRVLQRFEWWNSWVEHLLQWLMEKYIQHCSQV